MSKHIPLSRERILQTALQILDEQGMDGLSMRRLAALLGVEAMSLYNHIKNKQDLLDGVADMVLAQIELPDNSLPWHDRLESITLALYLILIGHPSLALVLASEQGRPGDARVMQGMDRLIAALEESGLEPQQQVNAYRGLLAMCFGFVLVHTQGMTKTREQAQAEWEQWDSDQWNPENLPHMARLAPYFLQTHAEDDFRFMLQVYLNYLIEYKSKK